MFNLVTWLDVIRLLIIIPNAIIGIMKLYRWAKRKLQNKKKPTA